MLNFILLSSLWLRNTYFRFVGLTSRRFRYQFLYVNIIHYISITVAVLGTIYHHHHHHLVTALYYCILLLSYNFLDIHPCIRFQSALYVLFSMIYIFQAHLNIVETFVYDRGFFCINGSNLRIDLKHPKHATVL